MVIIDLRDMRLAILTIDDSTVCDQQERECDGISCKICQFNKIGVDVKFLMEMIFRNVRDYLVDDANSRKDAVTKAEDISCNIIQLLLKEEADERVIGEKVFKKIIH